MSPDLEEQLKQWQKINKRPAKKLAAKPQLTEYLNWLLMHFFRLSQHRQYAFSAQPLMISEIFAYADRIALPKGWGEFFFGVMSDLDGEFLKVKGEEAEREKEGNDEMKGKKGKKK